MSKTDRTELERLLLWKAEAIEVLARWDQVALKVPNHRLGKFKSVIVGSYIDELHARIAELEAIPPHPAFLPWLKTDFPVIVKTESGWVHIGPELPVEAP